MEQRYQAVMAVQVDGLEVTVVAEKFGVSRQTVHAWLRRYEDGGLDGLADRSHRPVSCPHQMAPAVEAAVCELRRQHPYWGPARIRVSPRPRRCGSGALAYGDLSGSGPSRAHRSERASQTVAGFQAVGTGPAHGAVAARCRRWGVVGRWDRVQGAHRHRRSLSVRGVRRCHDPGCVSGRVRAFRRRVGPLWRARRSPHRQRPRLHWAILGHRRSRCCSTGSVERTASTTC